MKQTNNNPHQVLPPKGQHFFLLWQPQKNKLVAWPTTSVLIATSLYLITSGKNIGQLQKE
jgi:hypothetical protein